MGKYFYTGGRKPIRNLSGKKRVDRGHKKVASCGIYIYVYVSNVHKFVKEAFCVKTGTCPQVYGQIREVGSMMHAYNGYI